MSGKQATEFFYQEAKKKKKKEKLHLLNDYREYTEKKNSAFVLNFFILVFKIHHIVV